MCGREDRNGEGNGIGDREVRMGRGDGNGEK